MDLPVPVGPRLFVSFESMERIAKGALALLPSILQPSRKFTGHRRKNRMLAAGNAVTYFIYSIPSSGPSVLRDTLIGLLRLQF